MQKANWDLHLVSYKKRKKTFLQESMESARKYYLLCIPFPEKTSGNGGSERICQLLYGVLRQNILF